MDELFAKHSARDQFKPARFRRSRRTVISEADIVSVSEERLEKEKTTHAESV